MFVALYDFFRTKVFTGAWSDANFPKLNGATIQFFNNEVPLVNYLCYLCSLISISIIVVLCCLFVYKIVRLIGGLIR